MTISILCITNNQYEGTGDFIKKMAKFSKSIGAEFVLGLDRETAWKAPFRKLADIALDLKANTLQEDVMDEAINSCSGEWILRLDDDETVSPALGEWITNLGYLIHGSPLYTFPRVYLYPDEKHYLNNPSIFPDQQTRLGLKSLMYGVNYIHAGNPNGAGTYAPFAIEHHKLLVRSYDERLAIAERYDSIREGAGSLPDYARYNLPEKFYPELIVSDYGNGAF
jgi:hypothetical protein